MKRLYEKKPVLHSLVWLAIYLILNTIIDNAAKAMNADFNLVTGIPNLILAAVCFFYLKSTGIAKEIGLIAKPVEKASVMLLYLPLLALSLLNLFYGINTSLSAIDVLLMLAMYVGVGFMEEIVFRGLMFRALNRKWNRYVVVAFISLTFAIGHIVSMAAVGMSGGDTILQIINALVVGFMFMAVMIASKNLTMCVIVHVLYNFVANISLVGYTHKEIIVLNTVITVAYFVYLVFRAGNVKAYFSKTETGADF